MLRLGSISCLVIWSMISDHIEHARELVDELDARFAALKEQHTTSKEAN